MISHFAKWHRQRIGLIQAGIGLREYSSMCNLEIIMYRKTSIEAIWILTGNELRCYGCTSLLLHHTRRIRLSNSKQKLVIFKHIQVVGETVCAEHTHRLG